MVKFGQSGFRICISYMATHHQVSHNCVTPGRSSSGGAVPPQFFVSVHVSGGCFRRRMSNQDGDTTATLSSPVSGLLMAPWSRKRMREESAAKLRQKQRLVEQTDVTRPEPSSASTLGSSEQDLVAPLTLALFPTITIAIALRVLSHLLPAIFLTCRHL